MDASYLTQLTFPSCDGGCLAAMDKLSVSSVEPDGRPALEYASMKADDILEDLCAKPAPLPQLSRGSAFFVLPGSLPRRTQCQFLDGCSMEVSGVDSVDDYRYAWRTVRMSTQAGTRCCRAISFAGILVAATFD